MTIDDTREGIRIGEIPSDLERRHEVEQESEKRTHKRKRLPAKDEPKQTAAKKPKKSRVYKPKKNRT